ncbi:protein FAR1-RELATED SEQUENCE 5-like [Trifolium pratense]|uniref:protein FAR1-RELATED SEQUENCE 5-like n=1 Tax=Trifolium pratense TaxID=57577 RepID=UPI001E693E75|nr:protein FAR1-RELATED SEQUENCE 5-like [Trifolium pratense]
MLLAANYLEIRCLFFSIGKAKPQPIFSIDEAFQNQLKTMLSQTMTIVATPSVGMKFDSVNEAWEFWAAYGKEKGFGVRKQYTNKRKDGYIRSFRFVCCKEGHRTKNPTSLLVKNPKAETRTGCPTRIALSRKDEKFVIHEFVEAHNHLLQLPETTHMLASHRKISEVQAYEIEMAEDSGLMQKASFQLMSAHVGGRDNLGYTRLDAKNYLKERRKCRMLFGEVGSLMEYFQKQHLENPSFYHAYQMDCEEQITNVFWTDARMISDYGYFGDVVSLDTTYCTNGANRPLALFSRQYVGDLVVVLCTYPYIWLLNACECRQNDDELENEDSYYIASDEEDDDDDDDCYTDDSEQDECVDLSVVFPPERFCLIDTNVGAMTTNIPTTAADFRYEFHEDSDVLHTPPESEDEELGHNYPTFKMSDGSIGVQFHKGLTFNNKQQANEAIKEHAMETMKNLYIKKNEKEFLVVKLS